MRINLEIFDGTSEEITALLNKMNELGMCVSVTNYANSAASVPEQEEKKVTINDIWETMLAEMPGSFDKYGIARYCAPSKLSSKDSDELDRYIELRLKNDFVVLSIPNPDNLYTDITFMRYTSRIQTRFNEKYFSELLDQTVDDPEMRNFIEKYFTK